MSECVVVHSKCDKCGKTAPRDASLSWRKDRGVDICDECQSAVRSPARPTCGTCPHSVSRESGRTYCHAIPDRAGGTPEVDDDSPGCIYHPDMAEYVAERQRSKENQMNPFANPEDRAAFIHGQRMEPCPKCGSYEMEPQIPVRLAVSPAATPREALVAYVRSSAAGPLVVEGPAYYQCGSCGHKGPAVDCTGRTSDDCRRDPILYSKMKALWNGQRKDIP